MRRRRHGLRYVVTGSTGFIGAQLCSVLAIQGHTVIALGRDDVRLKARFSAKPVVETLTYLRTEDGAIDLLSTVTEAAGNAPIDGAINLAGLAHVRSAAPGAYRADVSFARDLATACSILAVPALVNISSIAARDWATAGRPALRAYGEAKLDAEREIDAVATQSGLVAVTLRPPAVWGPDAPGSFATIRKLLALGLPLPIRSLQARRAYIHVESLCRRIVHILTVLGSTPFPPSHSVLEVADQPLSLPEIFAAVASEMDVTLRTFSFPPQLLTFGLRSIGKTEMAEIATTVLTVDPTQVETFVAGGHASRAP